MMSAPLGVYWTLRSSAVTRRRAEHEPSEMTTVSPSRWGWNRQVGKVLIVLSDREGINNANYMLMHPYIESEERNGKAG